MRSSSVHGDCYVIFESCDSKITIICKEHGEFKQSIFNHFKGAGCPLCANKNNADRLTKTTDWFVNRAENIHKNKYDYSKVEYFGCRTEIQIICSKHGEFSQKPIAHLNGYGCQVCAGTNSEAIMYEILKEMFPVNIFKKVRPSWLKQSDTCKNLELDAFCKELNLAFEYQGAQHERYVPYFHRRGIDDFFKQVERDKIKK